MSRRVLVVDDDAEMCAMVSRGLQSAGYATETCGSVAVALECLEVGDFDAILTDLRMPKASGLDLCRSVVANRPDIPVIVLTAFGSMETAIEAIRAGAYDFVTKPVELDSLRIAVRRAVEHRDLAKRVDRLEQALRETRAMDEMLGTSPAMRRVFDLVERVAPSDSTVLTTGESGTGKELVARALHRRSPRASGPFIAINCAAMPESLLESELFGHVKGAFTDAKGDREGLFQRAHGGTLFLDEIGELPLGLQPKLLRVLQERAIRQVGGREEIPFDARVIAATNRDLEAAVEDGRFREDLYYRINVIQIPVPPLRARGNDVLLLARHFMERNAKISGKSVRGFLPAAAERLLAYVWPGNVRELQNCIERAVTLCRYSEITVEDLPDKIRDSRPSRLVLDTDDLSQLVPMEEIERRYVLRVFEAVGQNKSLAAKTLGFNRKTLYRKLQRWGAIEADHDQDPDPPSR
ncbi:MAG TPA: sigma-54 dependent transcriptional regulator [Nannocystaceae bacterium]|nr:sigma-54 dependent transcriptional regulator [Nannocystaceae bacterium]